MNWFFASRRNYRDASQLRNQTLPAAFFRNVAADLRLSLWTATPAHASALSAIDTRSDLYMLYTNIERNLLRVVVNMPKSEQGYPARNY